MERKDRCHATLVKYIISDQGYTVIHEDRTDINDDGVAMRGRMAWLVRYCLNGSRERVLGDRRTKSLPNGSSR